VSAALGVVCAVVGAVLAVRPFTSLSVLVVLVAVAALVTGVSDLLTASESESPRLAVVVGALWVVVGIAVLAWPGLTIRVLTVWVGVGLLVAGVLRMVAGIRGTADQRVTAMLSGLASIVFGVLALSWPDVTVLVIAVVFGARTVLFGLPLIVAALRRPGTAPARPAVATATATSPSPSLPTAAARRSRLARWSRTVGAVVSLVVALLLLLVSATIHKTSPKVTAFYVAPKSVPSRPGALLRVAPFTTAVPSNAQAWLILYTTTRDDGVPAVASAEVMAARDRPATPRPVIAWAHGTTGFATKCAPTLLKDPLASGAMPAVPQVLVHGWVIVATDYLGLGTAGPHPYLIGQGEARSVLDAVRAAKQLTQLSLADQTVVWGHSQGGNAALWTGQLAPSYAPDDHVIGIAALAPASDLIGLVRNINHVPGGAVLASYVIEAYSQIYPDVKFNAYIRPAAQTLVHKYAERCLSGPEVFVSIASALTADKPIFNAEPTFGALGQRLAENTPTSRIQAPLLVAQGETDPLVLPSIQHAYVQRRCSLGGGPLEYKTYPGRDHVGVVDPDSALIPDLIAWTTDRINGQPAPSNC
jgi:uncharacterized membrane protein HdeD (DUF308 family)/pimeloyl-ACP methyl ester carboxylesterase